MSSTMTLSREGHLRSVFQILSFLKSKQNFVTVFGPTKPEIDETQFLTEDQSTTPCALFRKDVTSNAPAPRGFDFI